MNPFNGACQLCFEDFDTDVSRLAGTSELHRLPISCVNCEKTLCYQCYRYLQKAQTRNIESYQGVRCPGCKYEKGFPRKQPSFNRALCMVLWDLQQLSQPHTTGEPTAGTSNKRGLRTPFLQVHPTTGAPATTTRIHLSMTTPSAHRREGVTHAPQSTSVETSAPLVATTMDPHTVSPAAASTESQKSRIIVTGNPVHKVPVPPFVDVLAEASHGGAGVVDHEEVADSPAVPKHSLKATSEDSTPNRLPALPPSEQGQTEESGDPGHSIDTALGLSEPPPVMMDKSTQPSALAPPPSPSKRRKKEGLSDPNSFLGTTTSTTAISDNGLATVQRYFPPFLKGKGWGGIAQLGPEALPTSLAETLQLLDHLFPGGSYYQRMYMEADVLDSKGQHRWGKKTRDKLRKLRMRFPNLPGVSWYQDKRDKDWAPPNQEHLERFAKVLMELDDLLK